jgi:small-conductance mechanosensitive channel
LIQEDPAMLWENSKTAVTSWIDGLGLSTLSLSLVAVLAASLILLVVLRILNVVFRRFRTGIDRWKDTRLGPLRFQQQEILSAEEIAQLMQGALRVLRVLAILLLLAVYLTIVVAIFPFTQKVAIVVVDQLVAALGLVGTALVGYLPELLQILIYILLARYLIRLAQLVFNGIESRRIRVRGFYPDWAEPTFKIFRILLVALTAVIIIPLLPGASSPAFKGVTIFLGALVSLGSTGAVANVVGGTVITYMRAFQAGDRVRIADTEGTVIKRTTFVTKILTPKNAIIAVPNAMVLANHIVNYSELAKAHGLILHTTVTIGYDVPWRRVHELLLDAAHRTERVEEDPEPFVLQTSLDDFYVSYELNVYVNNPIRMALIYSELHANIQDAFHEAGVEIASPYYSAIRDGHRAAIPDDHLPKDYEVPAIRIHPLEKLIPPRKRS